MIGVIATALAWRDDSRAGRRDVAGDAAGAAVRRPQTTVRRTAWLFHEGDPSGDAFFIESGLIKLMKFAADGSRAMLPLLADGGDRTHRASFSAMSPTRVAVADPGQFRAILDEFPVVARRILEMTEIRRAYLAGLAEGAAAAPVETAETGQLPAVYPAHMYV